MKLLIFGLLAALVGVLAVGSSVGAAQTATKDECRTASFSPELQEQTSTVIGSVELCGVTPGHLGTVHVRLYTTMVGRPLLCLADGSCSTGNPAAWDYHPGCNDYTVVISFSPSAAPVVGVSAEDDNPTEIIIRASAPLERRVEPIAKNELRKLC